LEAPVPLVAKGTEHPDPQGDFENLGLNIVFYSAFTRLNGSKVSGIW